MAALQFHQNSSPRRAADRARAKNDPDLVQSPLRQAHVRYCHGRSRALQPRSQEKVEDVPARERSGRGREAKVRAVAEGKEISRRAAICPEQGIDCERNRLGCVTQLRPPPVALLVNHKWRSSRTRAG